MPKKLINILISLFVLILSFIGWAILNTGDENFEEYEGLNVGTGRDLSPASTMQISSPAFGDNQQIPSQYTCDGANISPPLQFSDIPDETKSLVLIVDDPDAPSKTWLHWLVYNIPPDTPQIPEGSLPQGANQGVTDFKTSQYGGPCPPKGQHRYFFKLFALDEATNYPANSTLQAIQSAIKDHIITKAELVGVYERNN